MLSLILLNGVCMYVGMKLLSIRVITFEFRCTFEIKFKKQLVKWILMWSDQNFSVNSIQLMFSYK